MKISFHDQSNWVLKYPTKKGFAEKKFKGGKTGDFLTVTYLLDDYLFEAKGLNPDFTIETPSVDVDFSFVRVIKIEK